MPGRIKRIAIGDGSLVTANVVDGRLMLAGRKGGRHLAGGLDRQRHCAEYHRARGEGQCPGNRRAVARGAGHRAGREGDRVGAEHPADRHRASRHAGAHQGRDRGRAEPGERDRGRRGRCPEEDDPLQGADHGAHAQCAGEPRHRVGPEDRRATGRRAGLHRQPGRGGARHGDRGDLDPYRVDAEPDDHQGRRICPRGARAEYQERRHGRVSWPAGRYRFRVPARSAPPMSNTRTTGSSSTSSRWWTRTT
ncbi:hypothetical protein [Burkholderia gladioli]|uniref:hypothetical protein n=1 Tax=Burkholderia gladioli TaxID=28095 RepID=UPI003D1C0480